MSNFLTAEEITNAVDLQELIVDVKEWGGSIKLVAMSGLERAKFETEAAKISGEDSALDRILLFLSQVITDGSGNKLFEGKTEILGKKSYVVLLDLFEKANGLNAITVQEIENLSKN